MSGSYDVRMKTAVPDLSVVDWDWRFTSTRASPRVQATRLRSRFLRRAAAPPHQIMTAPTGSMPWSLYFLYMPDAVLTPAHQATLTALHALGRPLLAVCATPTPSAIPSGLRDRCDALIWKGLSGFDFSAYAIGLLTLARCCPGSDAFVMNDSVFGPIGDLRPWLERARWDLTGFTATANCENHIQSYAFHLKDVTPQRMAALSPILMPAHAYDDFWSVVLEQETRFARIAARTMTVGALCYVCDDAVEDPSLQLALPLLAAGFPFCKKSLLGKLQHRYPRDQVIRALGAAGYELDPV